jgi:hypothetical protein
MLNRIRTIAYSLPVICILGISLFLLLSFIPGFFDLLGAPVVSILLDLLRLLMVGFFTGIGMALGVALDSYIQERKNKEGKGSKTYCWLIGGVIGTLIGPQILTQTFDGFF